MFRPRCLINTEVKSKKRSDLFMEVFEFGDHPLKEVNALCGWWPTLVGYTSPTPRRSKTTQRKLTTQKEYSPPTDDIHHPQRKVTDFSTYRKMLIFIRIGPACLLLNKNWVKGIFTFCMNRAIEKCEKLIF